MSIRLTRVLCGKRVIPSVIDYAVESRTVKVKEIPKPRGKHQWWRKPVYCAPHVHPLERGVDFTFQDGRPLFATSKREVERKLKQIELGKKVVRLLAEMREAETLYTEESKQTVERQQEFERLRPKAKGNESIC